MRLVNNGSLLLFCSKMPCYLNLRCKQDPNKNKINIYYKSNICLIYLNNYFKLLFRKNKPICCDLGCWQNWFLRYWLSDYLPLCLLLPHKVFPKTPLFSIKYGKLPFLKKLYKIKLFLNNSLCNILKKIKLLIN